jgi:hypothetical protein
LTDIRYPSGRTISNSYDQAGRISQVFGNWNSNSTTYASLPTVFGTSYAYGASSNNGNLLSQTITRGSQTWSQNYSSYDSENRLTYASEGSNWSQTYGYGGFGNRAVTAGYIPNPALTATNPNQFINNRWTGAGYDNAGNQTWISVAQVTNTYDEENRLRSSWSVANPSMEMYSYDGEGRRVMKMKCPSSSSCTTAHATSVSVFVYDAAGMLTAEYGPVTGSGTSYLTADHLGSTRVVTDSTGSAERCYDYLPFGEEIPNNIGGRAALTCYSSGAYPALPDIEAQKFTGKERDAETGLDWFEARYMSSAQGRFTHQILSAGI